MDAGILKRKSKQKKIIHFPVAYKTFNLFLIIESGIESIYVWTDGRFVVSYMNQQMERPKCEWEEKKWFQVQFEWHMSYSRKIQRSSFTLRMPIHKEKSDVASKLLPLWAFAILYEKMYIMCSIMCVRVRARVWS